MAEAPGGTLACCVAQTAAPGRQAGNCGKMVGLHCVLQAEQKAEYEDTEHR
jgi:hypothetical protein